MNYIDQFQKQNATIKMDEDLVKQLHKLTVEKILADEQCGVFRKTQVVVKNSQTGEISFRPPMAVAVPFQIRNLLEFVDAAHDEDVNSVLKSGIVHYELVRVHPFLDGNGRVARALDRK